MKKIIKLICGIALCICAVIQPFFSRAEGEISPFSENDPAKETSVSNAEVYSAAEDSGISTYSNSVIRTVYNAGGNTLTDVLGMSRSDVLNVLKPHINDNYYLGTPYKAGDCRNPNGDPSGYGTGDAPGVPGMNCTGFVWHVLTSAGGTNVPGISGWVTLLRDNNIEYITYQGTNGLSGSVVEEALVADAEPGDIIWSWDDSAGPLVNGLSYGTSAKHHVGIYVGTYFNDKGLDLNNPTGLWNSTTPFAWWHSLDSYAWSGEAPSTNHVSWLTPKSEQATSYTLIKLGGDLTGRAQLKKTSSNPAFTEDNPCYSLAGAVYGVYSDSGCTAKVAELTTNDGGESNTITLNEGNYWIREITAPKGFAMDKQVYAITVTNGETTTLEVKDAPQHNPLDILLRKTDRETAQYAPEGNASLAGAEFTVKYYKGLYDINPAESGAKAAKTWVLKTDSNGVCRLNDSSKVSGDAFYTTADRNPVFPLGTVTIQETKAPAGYLINKEVFVRKITASGSAETVSTYQIPEIPESVIRGGVLVEKWDSELNQNTAQGAASLQGAKFQLISLNDNPIVVDNKTYGKNSVITTLTTDAQGKAQTADDYLPYGNYRIKETSPPAGYQNTGVLQQDFSISENGVLVTLNTSDTALKNHVIRGGVQIEKWDYETNQNKPQGSATLQGAKFQLISLNDNPIYVNNKVYNKSEIITTLTTNAAGTAQTAADYLPYGNYRVREISPPEGYNHSGVLQRDFTISKNKSIVNLNAESTAIRNNVIRGDIQLVKFAEDKNSDIDRKTPLEGIVFTLTSKTTGKTVQITTDKNGYASTTQLNLSKRGNLVYDTYTVHEENTPEGYKPVSDFEVTISQENETLYYILEDKLILSPVQLVKTDQSTGNIIPIADAEFELLDQNKNRITMTTYYPEKIVHETFRTNDQGVFTLPEKLKPGTYSFRELNAPEGYLLGEEVEFKITEGHDWSEPFPVEYPNTPAMGQIHIIKTVTGTDDPLAGAVFEITAAKDIVTPDGTTRLRAGEVADTVTTEADGTAVSKELYLGNYLVRETSAPAGYVLSGEEYPVALKYQDQNTPLVTETIEAANRPTELKLIKTDAESGQPLGQVKYAVWKKTAPEEESAESAQKETYATDAEGLIVLYGLTPGTYCFQEVETLPGYVLNEEIHELTIDENGRVNGKDSGVLLVKNTRTQLIRTSAKDAATDLKEAVPKKNMTLVDTVEFQNLQTGQEYKIIGTLMDRSPGEPLRISDENGKLLPVSAEKVFTAETADGTIDIEFQFDASSLKGRSVVVFESVWIGDTEILSHKDLDSSEQTIEFPDSQIQTTAQVKESGTRNISAGKKITVTDTVTYRNLIVGQEYHLEGILMDRETGSPLLIKGKAVTAGRAFVPETKDGNIELKFTLDTSGLEDKKIVVFEDLYSDSVKVASHTDLDDEHQTITISAVPEEPELPGEPPEEVPEEPDGGTPTVSTGDSRFLPMSVLFIFTASSILLFCALFSIILRHRRKRNAKSVKEP